jgi:energy-coupling factor transport system permease protein
MGGSIMDRFSKLNPKVTFLYFIFVIILTLMLFHPAFLLISFVGALAYKTKLDGKKVLPYLFKFILPLILFVAVFNMLFTHYGMTTIFEIGDTIFTFEGLFYGLCQGLMFASIIIWFSCYSQVVTSERFLAVFGKIAPNTALVFSMVLSFIPRMRKNAQEINDARALVDKDISKIKRSIKNFSALLTLTLEESIQVSDSMKARGFDKGRTVYSKYKFSFVDGAVLAGNVLLFISLCIMKGLGRISFIYEPVITIKDFSILSLVLFIFTSFLPIIIDFTEDMRWLYLKQKI